MADVNYANAASRARSVRFVDRGAGNPDSIAFPIGALPVLANASLISAASSAAVGFRKIATLGRSISNTAPTEAVYR